MSYLDYSRSMTRIRDGMAKQQAMRKLRREGWTLRRIAEKYGISAARVCQIIGPTRTRAVRMSARGCGDLENER